MQQPLRVAHLITNLDCGGAQISTLNTLLEMEKDPLVSTYLIFNGNNSLNHIFSKLKNTKVLILPHLKRRPSPLSDFLIILHLHSFLKSQKIEILHTHCSKPSIIGRLAALTVRNIKIYHTYHGFGHDYYHSLNPIKKLHIKIEKYLNKHSTPIFICKENKNRALQDQLINKKSIYLTIPDAIFFPEKRIKKEKSATIKIGSVLSFKKQKNPFLLLKIIKNLIRCDEKILIYLFGEGPLKRSCQRWISRKKLTKNVHFMGVIDNIHDFYPKMDLLISTSRFEGFSMAQIESLFHQVPIVTTEKGGIKDIFYHGEQGYLIKEFNIQKSVEFCREILYGSFKYKGINNQFFKQFLPKKIAQQLTNHYLNSHKLGGIFKCS